MMVMVETRIKGFVDENGQLTVQGHVPDDFPRGEVEVKISVAKPEMQTPEVLTSEEESELERDIQESLEIFKRGGQGKSGAEIVEMLQTMKGWEDYGITDPVAWLEEQRQKDWQKKFGDQTW